MILKLFWNDAKGIKYHLGNLYKIEDIYHFDINEEELKNAVRHGCFGIGNIDITKNRLESKELFSFFKNRIPEENELSVEQLKKYYGIDKYDEMEILKITQGRLLKDRYYLEYVKE